MGNLRSLKRKNSQGAISVEPSLKVKQEAHNSKKGRYNGYKCETCGVITLTVDRDEGVTPMFLACRADEGCPGQSHSLGYPGGPIPAELLPVKWEWYKPDAKELSKLDAESVDYHLRGGLALRRIDATT